MVSYVFAFLIFIVLIWGTVFVIKNKKRNVVYPIYPFIDGIAFSFLSIVLPFVDSGDVNIFFEVVFFCISVPFILSPVLFHYKFDESGFERHLFFKKTQFRYEEITGCGYAFAYKGGSIYAFELGRAREIRFRSWINVDKFTMIVCKKYRENHNGKEIPGIMAFPHCTKYTDTKISLKIPKNSNPDTPCLRTADKECKCRVFVEANIDEYNICYRRANKVNEFVINGLVYAEYKKFFEGGHHLSANIDGHEFIVGFNANTSRSFIIIDEICVAEKFRLW